MEMKHRNFRKAVIKGELGESIFREYLENQGWVVYFPFTKDRPHYFDLMATKDKEKVIAVDVKTKQKLYKYNAQGVDLRHYEEYIRFVETSNVPFYLVFIDSTCGDVHAQEITKLNESISPCNGIIAWPLNQMKLLFNIGEENLKMLSEHDQSNYRKK